MSRVRAPDREFNNLIFFETYFNILIFFSRHELSLIIKKEMADDLMTCASHK